MIQTPMIWVRQRLENGIRSGLQHAYQTVRVDSARFLLQLQAGHGLAINSFRGVYTVEIEQLDEAAAGIIRGGMKIAAVEGAGLGLGGIATLVPDLSILAGITLRMIQKLSLLYGFEFNTDEEMAELWVAAASAAGIDISRELLEKEVVNRFVPKVIQRIAASASAEAVEKWSLRFIPVISSVLGAGLNYYFVRAWGNRVQAHFRRRHLEVRQSMAESQNATAAPWSLSGTR